MEGLRGVWRAGELDPRAASGFQQASFGNPAPPLDAIFDLASLTKPLVTGALYTELWLESGLSWESFASIPLKRWLPELAQLGNGQVAPLTLGALLEHRSGLPAHIFCFDPPRRWPSPQGPRDSLWRHVLNVIAEAVSKETKDSYLQTKEIYSDLGFLLLGAAYERLRDEDLAAAWSRWKLARGLDPASLSFGVFPHQQNRWSLTEPAESRHPKGEVNDDNAASLGGVAPHAGLFGSLEEVWSWFQAVRAWSLDEPRVREWLIPAERVASERFFRGWDRPSGDELSQGGFPAPLTAVGHLGYTGTALWFDWPSGRAAILLTHRVAPVADARSAEAIKKLRRGFFSAFWQGKLYPSWEHVGRTL